MFGSHFRDFVSQEQDQSNKVLKKSNSRDSGTEEEFEILGQEEIKERRHSEDSGNCSEAEETNKAIELEFQLTQFLLSQVKADENNRNANSGKQARLDLERMDFVINGQTISKEYVRKLYYQHNHLILNENYRTFAKQVFTGMFEYAKAEVPDNYILEELITNCNQAGYEFAMYGHIHSIFSQHSLVSTIPKKIISFYCNSAESVNVEYSDTIVIKNSDRPEQYESDSKLEFMLKSKDGKVDYENGKVTLTVPEELKAGRKNLLNEITEYFEDKDNRIIETLEKNMNEGSKSFSAEDLSITESSSDSSEVANKVVTDPGILGNVANVLVGVAEVTAVVATELFWPQDQVNIELRHNEKEFTIIPKNLTFDGLIDVINKAKNYGDYAGLDKTINNIEESDRFITDLNCGNLKDFCSQQLNLTDHTHNVLLNNSYDETNGYYNHSVKELSLLAIAANDTLVERYAETHKSILFTQDEGLDRLLIGVGGQCYIKFLLEHLDKPNHTMFLDGICKKLERASFVGNQKCVEVILNRFKNTEAEGRIIFSSKLLHYAIHLAPESKAAEVIVNRKVVDINSIDNSGIAPLHYAVARDNFKLISLLIENGANVDVQDERHGRTALWAAYHDKFEIVKLLVNKGADWNIKDRDGKTALDLVGTKSLYLVREENREKSSSESKITKFLEGLDDKTPLHLNIKKDPEFKNIDNQRPQRSIVDKGENIMNNEKASIEEAMDNNYRRGKMPGNEKIIGKKLSNAVDRINLTGLIHLLKKLEVSTYEPTVQKLLDQANDKITNLGEGKQKEALEQIILFLENELKHTAATLPVDNNVEAAASSQEAPLVESKESSPSLSSEKDDFSKLEGNKSDCSAGTSSDSNSNSPFEKISEEGHETRISVIDTMEAEATANGTVSSNSVPCTLRVELTSDDEDELLSIEIEDVNNDINVNQPTEHVEQVANGNGQPKTELPRINEQSSKSGLKKNPQNTKKYVVAASALAIAGIVSGVAVAVYLEMLAVGIAVAACCLIAATVTYCCRPKSLIENGEPAEIVFKERSVY